MTTTSTNTSAPEHALVSDVARALVAEMAPEELALFGDYAEEFFAHPEALLREQEGNDELLGFGAADALQMLTPFALLAVKEVLTVVWSMLRKPVEDQGSAAVSAWLRGVFTSAEAPTKHQGLTPMELAEVQRTVLDVAKRSRFPANEAKILSERVIARLALAGAR